MKTYSETCYKLAEDKYHNYMGGGSSYLYGVDKTIAWIYDIPQDRMSSRVNTIFKTLKERQNK